MFFFYFPDYQNLLLQGYEDGMTVIADNPFVGKKSIVPFDKGIRIDYILFKVGDSLTHLSPFFIELCCCWRNLGITLRVQGRWCASPFPAGLFTLTFLGPY